MYTLASDVKKLAIWLDNVYPCSHQRLIEQVDVTEEASDTVLRVWLTYQGTPEMTPACSIILKIPSQNSARREVAKTYFLFPREVMFYSHLAGQSPLTTPRCHYASIEESALILEDHGRFVTGDQEYGYQTEEAKSVVRHMAQFHAYWMGKADKLDAIPSVNQSEIIAMLPTALEHTWAQCYPHIKDYVPIEIHRGVARLVEEIPAIAAKLAQSPMTLLHGDLRMENMLFQGTELSSLVDWQLLARGSAMVDIAYFLTQSGSREHRTQVENYAIKLYSEALQPFDITESQLWEEYRLASFYGLIVPIFAAASDLQHTQAVRPLIMSAFQRLREVFQDLSIDV